MTKLCLYDHIWLIYESVFLARAKTLRAKKQLASGRLGAYSASWEIESGRMANVPLGHANLIVGLLSCARTGWRGPKVANVFSCAQKW